MIRGRLCLISAILVSFLSAVNACAEIERIVILKADGLPFDILDSIVQRKDPYTGKSVLPWIEHVFYQHGTRLRNFYSRGLSLSGPSWAMLDTGQPSVIKGNLEFDRLTMQPYDYLNMFLHVVRNSARHEVVTPGVQVLDEQQLPLLSDAYLPSERYSSLQLFTRGVPPGYGGVKRVFTFQNPKEWLDEWTIGLEGNAILIEVFERDLIAKLNDPNVHYLDFLIPTYDHTAHVSRESEAILRAMQQIDDAVRRVWTVIEQGPLADKTALVLVSDHGMNTDPAIYSQGYSLVDFFTSAAGGGHHVVTNRPPLGEYALKSLSPAVPLITTSSPDSYYLKGQATKYPTILMDADGNERASIYMRDSDLNVLQLLWQQMARKDLKPEMRTALRDAFFHVLEQNRLDWNGLLDELRQELEALHLSIMELEERQKSESKIAKNRKKDASIPSTLATMKADESKYARYVHNLTNLLSLESENFDLSRVKIETVLPEGAMGSLNSVHDLQNYVAGLSTVGLITKEDGSLDMEKSFTHINYFSQLTQIKTRNNLQEHVASQPVDFIALAIPADKLRPAVPAEMIPFDNAIWLFRDDDRQALILSRRDTNGTLWMRYAAIRNLTQNEDGQIHFLLTPLREKMPLELWEGMQMSEGERVLWLGMWHSEVEWLTTFHATKYSNAMISLYEEFTYSSGVANRSSAKDMNDQLVRFHERKRRLAQADFIVFANDHWNFNYRGFNPGGNHGSFFRASTHSTLMVAGGKATRIPEGLIVDRPYDSLSLAPTILTLAGQITTEGFSTQLKERGFRPFSGPIIQELFGTSP
jgi:hypothetical protein